MNKYYSYQIRPSVIRKRIIKKKNTDVNTNTASPKRVSRGDRALQRFIDAQKSFNDNENLDYSDNFLDYKHNNKLESFSQRTGWMQLESILSPKDLVVFPDISHFSDTPEEATKKLLELYENEIGCIFLDNPPISNDYINDIKSSLKYFNQPEESLRLIISVLVYVEHNRTRKKKERFQQTMEQINKKRTAVGRSVGSIKFNPLNPKTYQEKFQKFIKEKENGENPKLSALAAACHISPTTASKYVKIYEEQSKSNNSI